MGRLLNVVLFGCWGNELETKQSLIQGNEKSKTELANVLKRTGETVPISTVRIMYIQRCSCYKSTCASWTQILSPYLIRFLYSQSHFWLITCNLVHVGSKLLAERGTKWHRDFKYSIQYFSLSAARDLNRNYGWPLCAMAVVWGSIPQKWSAIVQPLW